MRAGATIEELNALRKHAEQLKGGGLLRLAAPGRVHVLILSDVIGDPLDVIASGPISADPSTFADAHEILTRYEIELPPTLAAHLNAGMRGEKPETVKPDDPILALASHAMLGNNILAVDLPIAVGSAQCINGGVETQSGVDTNTNGQLESNEVTHTNLVCNDPATSLTSEQLASLSNNVWFSDAQTKLAGAQDAASKVVTESGKAKNVILFVGDGMGISTVTAARILAGQLQGEMGEDHQLSFETMPYSGFVKTYNVDAQTPESVDTMTAMASGVKTDVGVIGIDEAVERGSCTSGKGHELVTSLELAEIAGKSTGIVSTARITHATPAATYAKSADRNWEDISDMPASESANCEDIASQLVNFEKNLEARFSGVDVDGIEVVMGGGRRHFLPKDAAFNSADAVSAVEGDRTDNRDLTAEWKTQYPNGAYVMDQAGFAAIDATTTERVFGLFNESHMQYEADRGNDIAGEPSLSQMTEKAIDVLDNSLLVIEAIGGGNSDPWLVVYDDLGREVGQNDDYGDGLDSLVMARVQSGTYSVGVRQFDSGQGLIRLLAERYVRAQ